MRKSKLNSKERAALRQIGEEYDNLRYDWNRRLRNALLCMVRNDPRWIVWVEREIDPEQMSLQEMTRLIEARARVVVLGSYSFILGSRNLGDLIFKDSWVFTDRGALGPG